MQINVVKKITMFIYCNLYKTYMHIEAACSVDILWYIRFMYGPLVWTAGRQLNIAFLQPCKQFCEAALSSKC